MRILIPLIPNHVGGVVTSIIGQDGLPMMPTKNVSIKWFKWGLVPCRGSVVRLQVMDVIILIVARVVNVLFITLLVVVAMVDDQRHELIIENLDGHVLVRRL